MPLVKFVFRNRQRSGWCTFSRLSSSSHIDRNVFFSNVLSFDINHSCWPSVTSHPRIIRLPLKIWNARHGIIWHITCNDSSYNNLQTCIYFQSRSSSFSSFQQWLQSFSCHDFNETRLNLELCFFLRWLKNFLIGNNNKRVHRVSSSSSSSCKRICFVCRAHNTFHSYHFRLMGKKKLPTIIKKNSHNK